MIFRLKLFSSIHRYKTKGYNGYNVKKEKYD